MARLAESRRDSGRVAHWECRRSEAGSWSSSWGGIIVVRYDSEGRGDDDGDDEEFIVAGSP
jgi:hypothetical protein